MGAFGRMSMVFEERERPHWTAEPSPLSRLCSRDEYEREKAECVKRAAEAERIRLGCHETEKRFYWRSQLRAEVLLAHLPKLPSEHVPIEELRDLLRR